MNLLNTSSQYIYIYIYIYIYHICKHYKSYEDITNNFPIFQFLNLEIPALKNLLFFIL